MKIRLSLTALLIIMLVTTSTLTETSSNPTNVTLQDPTPDEEQPPIRTVNGLFQVFQEDNWKTLNISGISVTPEVENGTMAQFKGTVYNDGSQSAILKAFSVKIYNQTDLINTLSYQYPFGTTVSEISIPPRASKTQNFTTHLFFPDIDLSYTISIGFTYVLTSNRSLDLFAGYEYNYTLNIKLSDFPPPELLVIAFYITTLLIIFQLAIGYYGKRQKKLEKKKPKYH